MKSFYFLSVFLLMTSSFVFSMDQRSGEKESLSREQSLDDKNLVPWSQKKFIKQSLNRAHKDRISEQGREVWLPNDQAYLAGYEKFNVVMLNQYSPDQLWVRGQLPVGWSVSKRACENGTARAFRDANKRTQFRVFHYQIRNAELEIIGKQECQTTFVSGRTKKVEKLH